MALTAYRELHSVLHASGNLDLDCLLPADETRSTACAAGIGDNLPLTSTLGASGICHGPSEKGAGHMLNLASAIASRAGLNIGLILGSAATAVRAGPVTLYGDLLLDSLGNLLEGQPDSRTDVTTFVDTCLGPG